MWFSDVALVLPDAVVPTGSIWVERGVIAEIVTHPVPGGVSLLGHTVLPGFVDMHGDMVELEIQPRVKASFPLDVALGHLDARLAATGVTTAYAGVSFSRNASDGGLRSYAHTSEMIRALRAMRAKCRVDHRIHARFDITFEDAVGVLAGLLDDGSVDIVSVMDHTPGQGQYRDIERYIVLRAEHYGVSLEESRQAVMERIATSGKPEETLLTVLREVSALCRNHGVTLASHDDDTEAKAHLMADLGAAISEFPVTLEAAEIATARGLRIAMGAPNAMRGESVSGNLSARAAHRAGLLHILAADYHPAAILPAIRALAETDPDGLPGAVRLATANPAEALGLTDRGALEVGKRADLVLLDANDRVALTLCAGETVYANGTLAFPVETANAVK